MKFKDQIRKKKNKDSKGVKIIVTEQQFRRLIDRVVVRFPKFKPFGFREYFLT